MSKFDVTENFMMGRHCRGRENKPKVFSRRTTKSLIEIDVMGNKCKFCSSGKKDSTYTGSFHAFPSATKNSELREKWIQAVPESNFVPKKSTRICDLHFDVDDFKDVRTDNNVARNKSRGDLKQKDLKDDAVPHIWPGFPSYFSKISPKRRSESTTMESRERREKETMEKQLNEARESDRVASTKDIQEMISDDIQVQKLLTTEGKLILYQLNTTDPLLSVKFSLTINPDLSFELVSRGSIIAYSDVKKISGPKISFGSEVVALVTYLEDHSEDVAPEKVISNVASQLETLLEANSIDEEKKSKLQFLIAQLQLLPKVPTRRRYELSTLATCMTLFKTSPAAYKQLLSDNVLTLPSVQHLRRLSSALTVDLEFSESTVSYLKARFSRLNERERVINIILDEVKTDQTVDYTGGNILGEFEGVVTKGLLAVMIKSLGGKYRDVVAMVPVVSLKSTDMDEIYMKVLKGITDIGFSTTASSVDGHRVNKKFYKDLCGGKEVKPFIQNPFKPDEKIFLLYDTVHIFKCLYNIFLKRIHFEIPAFKEFPEMKPDFGHIKKIYEMEYGKSVKYAYKLNDKCLASQPIERCNVNLANAIFHESTINALEVYSSQYPDFQHTANFLKTIRKWWNIVNTNDVNLGKRKRDSSRDSISLENFTNAHFLSDFADWLENWQTASKGSPFGLTADTFFTAIHTSRTLPLLADYLLRVKNYKYVLLRNTQSDPLEGRFGEQRQRNGGNYYAGVRQFIEAEKTIRLKSLIKFSNLSMLEIKEVFKPNNEAEEAQIKVDAENFIESTDIKFCYDHGTQEDKAILFYASGYISKTIKKTEKCVPCQKLVVKDDSTVEVRFEDVKNDENISEYKKRFFDVINRGGLCNPSDAMYMATVHAQECFDQIFKDQETRSILLKYRFPRKVFLRAFSEKISCCEDTAPLANIKCENGHQFTKMLQTAALKIFNIGAKNYVNDINSKLHDAKKNKRKNFSKEDAKTESVRKISKLQSDKI